MSAAVEPWVDGGSHPTARRTTPTDWRDLLDLAERIANVEGFVPKALLGRPPAVLATLLAGDELGLRPMESLRAIFIIEGKVTLSAEVARALIYAAGHSLTIEADDRRALARGKRRGEADWTAVEWTYDRAKRAGLTSRQMWSKYPRQMLTARVSTEIARLMFPDVLAGLDIAEELADDTAEPPPKAARKKVSLVAPSGPPPSPEEPVEAPVVRSIDRPPLPEPKPARAPLVATEEPPPPPPGDAEDREDSGGRHAPPTSPDGAPEVGDAEDRTSEAAIAPDLPPSPTTGLTPQLRRLHARMSETFPDASREELDDYRHALVAIVTRGRPHGEGPVQSSSLLEGMEWAGFDSRLNEITAGKCMVARPEPGVVEFHIGGWGYIVRLTSHLDEAPFVDIIEPPR
jgi:hypothetical protein